MNPILLAVIAAVSAAVPTILLLISVGAPQLRAWLKAHVRRQELERLHAAISGAAVVVAAIAKQTPGFTLDDGIAQILAQVSAEVGKALVEKYGKEAVHYIAALDADERRPDIRVGPSTPPKQVPEVIRRASAAFTSSAAVPS